MPGTRSVDFEIRGEPVAKGSRVAFKNGGSRESSKRVAPWMESAVAQLARTGHVGGPVSVVAEFMFKQPKRPAKHYPSRSDLDKCCRALCDALTQGGVIDDDRHVIQLVARKAYAVEPRVVGFVVSGRAVGWTDWPEAA